MKKGPNENSSKLSNQTKKKQNTKKNSVFEIQKVKKGKNRKISNDMENIVYTYNITDKKNTTLRKIFNYHEISDIHNNILESNLNDINNTKSKNLLQFNYIIKCIFLDRHVKSYIKGEKDADMSLDQIEKEEKSKLLNIYIIKSEVVSEKYRNTYENNTNNYNLNSNNFSNNLNNSFCSNINSDFSLLQKKTYSGLPANMLNCGNSQTYSNYINNFNANIINNNLINDELNFNNNFKSNPSFLSANLSNLNSLSNLNNLNSQRVDVNALKSMRKDSKEWLLQRINDYVNNICIPNYSKNNSCTAQNIKANNSDNNSNAPTNNKNTNFFNNSNSLVNFGEGDKSKVRFANMSYEFISNFPEDFDCFEYEIIKVLSSKMNFPDFANILLFLYDDLKKLRDQKTIELLKNKLRDTINEDLSILKNELKTYYEHRSKVINDYLQRNVELNEWNEDKVINEIFLTSLIAEKLKNTCELDLTQNYIMGKNIQMIMSALKFNNFIWKINLNSNKIGEEGMYLLGRVLHYPNKITELDISTNFLTDKAIGLLTKGIDGNLINLQKLNLSNNNAMSWYSGEKIKELIILAPNLRTLNISRVNIEKGILNIFEALSINKNLEELICICTQLTEEILYLIANFFIENGEAIKLKKLNLSDNKFPGISAQEFFKSLCYNTSLKELIMYNCKLDGGVFESFCNMLKINRTLEKINFYNNEFNDFDLLKNVLRIKRYYALPKNQSEINDNVNPNKNINANFGVPTTGISSNNKKVYF